MSKLFVLQISINWLCNSSAKSEIHRLGIVSLLSAPPEVIAPAETYLSDKERGLISKYVSTNEARRL